MKYMYFLNLFTFVFMRREPSNVLAIRNRILLTDMLKHANIAFARDFDATMRETVQCT